MLMANLAMDKDMSTQITALLRESVRAQVVQICQGVGGSGRAASVRAYVCIFLTSAFHYAFCFAFNVGYLTRTST